MTATSRGNTNDETGRDGVLADFDQCRRDFEEAVRRAPDAALRYRPAGEDYALGGLVVHVTDVLRNYANVVQAIQKAHWEALTAPSHTTSAGDAALIRDGFGGSARGTVLDQMRTAHTELVNTVRASGPESFTRQAAVTFSGSGEPYSTSPADVVGWVRDHYKEHTQQIADLVSAWAEATR
jgi:hypothetical protein